METITIETLRRLEYSWSAEVLMENDKKVNIWWTCLPSITPNIKEILSVSSDYPRYDLKNSDLWMSWTGNK